MDHPLTLWTAVFCLTRQYARINVGSMARRLRCALGGYVYHVLNRGVGRATVFHKGGDYAAFEKVLGEAAEEMPMRLLAYCLMPNHWHLVLWPTADGDLWRYLHWVTLTHIRRYHEHYHCTGYRPLYQGRYRPFPVQENEHFYAVCRYVERNALRAAMVAHAEAWQWSSLWRRAQQMVTPWLSEWPLARPADWLVRVNTPETDAELEALRRSARRGSPFGEEDWRVHTARRLGLESSLRDPGRPKKETSSG